MLKVHAIPCFPHVFCAFPATGVQQYRLPAKESKASQYLAQEVNTTPSIRGFFPDRSLLKIQSVQKVTPVGGVYSPQVLRGEGGRSRTDGPSKEYYSGIRTCPGVHAKRVTIDGPHGSSVSSSLVTMMMACFGGTVWPTNWTALDVC